ncbi:MAG: hypothetical protein GYA14_10615 [Ignavibacteria bacterium]|nr:hypothetical protein [Ignavibacteria bacterium]
MSNKTVPIGELVEEFSVRAKSIADYSSFEFYGVSNEAGITKSKYAVESKAEEYKIIEKGCFAYNPYRINVGSIAYFDKDERGFISPAYIVFKTKQESIIPELLLKFLKSTEGLRQIKLHARGTVRQALRFEDLCRIKITIPSYDEQINLYKKVTAVEKETIALNKEINNQFNIVSKLRKAFLREAMQGKLTESWRKAIFESHPELVEGSTNSVTLSDGTIYEPASELLKKIKAEKSKLIAEGKLKKDKVIPLEIKKDEIPFQIPDSWIWCRLGELFWVTKLAGFEYTEHVQLKTVGEIPVVRAQNVKPNELIEDNLLYIDKKTSLLLNRCALVKKSLLITFIGAGIGDVAIFDKKERWHLAPNVAKAEPLIESLSLEYIMWFLLSNFGKDEFFKISKATAQPSLSMGTIRKVCIPLPPLAEQLRIVSKLNELMQFCDQLEQNINTAKEQTNLLLQTVLREALEPNEN